MQQAPDENVSTKVKNCTVMLGCVTPLPDTETEKRESGVKSWEVPGRGHTLHTQACC